MTQCGSVSGVRPTTTGQLAAVKVSMGPSSLEKLQEWRRTLSCLEGIGRRHTGKLCSGRGLGDRVVISIGWTNSKFF